MPRFDYIRPQTLSETLQLLADTSRRSRLLAGGTDLLIRIRRNPPDFDHIIDISRLPELKAIVQEEGMVRIGSSVTYTEIINSALLQSLTPFLVQAARLVGGPQVRNQGTIGGNIVNAAGGADMLPPLVCLDATLHLQSLRGQRAISLPDFILHPKQTGIQPDEVLTDIVFPAPPPGTASTFIKLGRQRTSGIARITVAAKGRLDAAGRIEFIRFAPGAVTPRVQRFAAVESMLLGEQPTPELLAQAGEEAARTMQTITGERWSTPYKMPALATLTRRALHAIFLPDEIDHHGA